MFTLVGVLVLTIFLIFDDALPKPVSAGVTVALLVAVLILVVSDTFPRGDANGSGRVAAPSALMYLLAVAVYFGFLPTAIGHYDALFVGTEAAPSALRWVVAVLALLFNPMALLVCPIYRLVPEDMVAKVNPPAEGQEPRSIAEKGFPDLMPMGWPMMPSPRRRRRYVNRSRNGRRRR